MRLSCLRSLLVNSANISKNATCGGGTDGSSWAIPSSVPTANKTPSRCNAAIASRFFNASNPNDRANLLANSLSLKMYKFVNYFLIFLL